MGSGVVVDSYPKRLKHMLIMKEKFKRMQAKTELRVIDGSDTLITTTTATTMRRTEGEGRRRRKSRRGGKGDQYTLYRRYSRWCSIKPFLFGTGLVLARGYR